MERYANTMTHRVEEVRGRPNAVGFPGERTRIVRGYIRADPDPDQPPETVG